MLKCISVDVHKCYEGEDFNEIFEVLSRWKNKEVRIKKELVEIFKYMHPDFEQYHFSLATKCLHREDMIVQD